MKLPSWISFAVVAQKTSAELACQASTEAECDGAACVWSQGSCVLSNGSVDANRAASLIQPALAQTSNRELQAVSMQPLNLAGLALMNSSSGGLFAGLNLNEFTPYSPNYFGSMFGGGGFWGNTLTDSYFTCPINVPFCQRQACSAHYDNESNAYSCYSQPGCCFDKNLFLHKRMFGSNFYKSVPVCYRAVDNPLFDQLAEQVTSQGEQFNPAYIAPIVNKVTSFMGSPITRPVLEQAMQCPPSDKTYQAYQFLQNLSAKFPKHGNTLTWMMSVDQYFDDLIDVLTPQCGWVGMNAQECVMQGCCWRSSTNKCVGALPAAEITEQKLDTAFNHINFVKILQKSGRQVPDWKSLNIQNMLAVQSMKDQTQNQGLNPMWFAGGDLKNYMTLNALTSGKDLSGMAMYSVLTGKPMDFTLASGQNLAMLSNIAALTQEDRTFQQLMVDNFAASTLGINPGNLWMIRNNQGSGVVAADNLSDGVGIPTPSISDDSAMGKYLKYSTLFGGKVTDNLLGGKNEQCPAQEVSINCMQPTSYDFSDFMGLYTQKSLCKARGCCWDQSRQNNNAFGLTRYTCHWNPEWDLYRRFSFLPHLDASLRGCCAVSACVQPEGREHGAEGALFGPRPFRGQPFQIKPQEIVKQKIEQEILTPLVDKFGKQIIDNQPFLAPALLPKNNGSKGVAHAKYTEWMEDSCSVECGGGTKNKYRDCVSGCGGLKSRREIKSGIPCNTHACNNGMNIGIYRHFSGN